MDMPLRPSGAGAWSNCALYATLSAAYREMMESDNNDVREDGTACHWLAPEVYEGRYPEIGSMSPNMREITEEMYDAVDLYLSEIKAWGDCEFQLEKPADCSVIYPGMVGTPDAWGYRPGHLKVVDLKFGFTFVEVFHNAQLSIYALAISVLLNLPDETKVELVIVQPRVRTQEGPVRRWFTTVGELRVLGMQLRAAAFRAMAPNPTATVGMWCLDCEGRIACDSYTKHCGALVDFAATGYHTNPDPAYADLELKFVTDAIAMLEARAKGLTSILERHIKRGGSTKYHTFSPGRGKEVWAEGCDKIALTLASEMFGVSIAKPVTPKQARRKLPSVIVDALTEKTKGSLRLTRIGKYDAEKAFSTTTEG